MDIFELYAKSRFVVEATGIPLETLIQVTKRMSTAWLDERLSIARYM